MTIMNVENVNAFHSWNYILIIQMEIRTGYVPVIDDYNEGNSDGTLEPAECKGLLNNRVIISFSPHK